MLNGGSLLTGGEGDLRRQLIEATKRIKSMSFSIRRIYGMDWDVMIALRICFRRRLCLFPLGWSFYTSDIVDWDKLTDDDFMGFRSLRNALALAVVNEASEIAGGSDIQRAREDGIVSESIGETTMAYTPGKGAVSIVAKTTWRMLLKYMDNRVIVRADSKGGSKWILPGRLRVLCTRRWYGLVREAKYEFAAQIKMGVVSFVDSIDKTSVRADSSASRGKGGDCAV